MAWLLIETMLDTGAIEADPNGLHARLQRLIESNELGDDWYHVTHLDPVIGEDEAEFKEILAKAIRFVYCSYWTPGGLWSSLKQPDMAARVGKASRYGESPNQEMFVGMLTRFALPALVPPTDDVIMRSLGWIRMEFWNIKPPAADSAEARI